MSVFPYNTPCSSVMSKQAFGLSCKSTDQLSVILQPPTDVLKGTLFVMNDERCWKLDLSDSVVTPHRTALKVPENVPKGESAPSATVANYLFVNGALKDAIGKGSYEVRIENDQVTVSPSYLIGGAEFSGSFTTFVPCGSLDAVRCMINELNRVYNDVEILMKEATEQGLTMELKSERVDPIQAQRIKEMNMLRKHVSAANPLVRAKKVQKGFGSK